MGIPWALCGERRYSIDAGWMEGIFPGSWMESWSVPWTLMKGGVVPLNLDEGWAILRNTGWRNRHSLGPRVEWGYTMNAG